jgi:hypothetical protein
MKFQSPRKVIMYTIGLEMIGGERKKKGNKISALT